MGDMNYCRTCRFWALNDHMIGAGICTNVERGMRLVREAGSLTAQDYGCVLHESGAPVPSIYNSEEQASIRQGFLSTDCVASEMCKVTTSTIKP